MQNTDTLPEAEALLRLAGLEKEQRCPDAHRSSITNSGKWIEDAQFCKTCNGSNLIKVPVLDLRESCPGVTTRFGGWKPCSLRYQDGSQPLLDGETDACQGRGWLPKQGRDALFAAMEKAGWNYTIEQIQGRYTVGFFQYRHIPNKPGNLRGTDANPWLAAAKALQAARY